MDTFFPLHLYTVDLIALGAHPLSGSFLNILGNPLSSQGRDFTLEAMGALCEFGHRRKILVQRDCGNFHNMLNHRDFSSLCPTDSSERSDQRVSCRIVSPQVCLQRPEIT